VLPQHRSVTLPAGLGAWLSRGGDRGLCYPRWLLTSGRRLPRSGWPCAAEFVGGRQAGVAAPAWKQNARDVLLRSVGCRPEGNRR
jgi:hypothetical protein